MNVQLATSHCLIQLYPFGLTEEQQKQDDHDRVGSGSFTYCYARRRVFCDKDVLGFKSSLRA